MLTGFESKVADFIKASSLFEGVSKILLAVSGGADSMALLHTMCALESAGIIKGELICTHINHQLRGLQADSDENFVVEQAHKLGLVITTRRLDVRGFARRNFTSGRRLHPFEKTRFRQILSLA